MLKHHYQTNHNNLKKEVIITNCHFKIKKLLDLYIRERQPAAATIKKYENLISIYIRDNFPCDDLSLTRVEIMIWRDKVIDRSTLANWNNYHRHFKALFQVAVDNQLINDNIFKSIKIVGTFSNAKKHYTKVILQRLKIT